MNKREEVGLTATERRMFAEVSQVLGKYEGQTREFGLNLVHSHFDVAIDEVMHETNDKGGRVLLTRPVKLDQMPAGARPTSWSVDKSGVAVVQTWCCD